MKLDDVAFKKIIAIQLVVILIFTAFVVVAIVQNRPIPQVFWGIGQSSDDFYLEVKTDKNNYSMGEVIVVEGILINDEFRLVSFSSNESATNARIEILDWNDTAIFNDTIIDVNYTITIDEFSSGTIFSYIWNQTDNLTVPVEPGNYTLSFRAIVSDGREDYEIEDKRTIGIFDASSCSLDVETDEQAYLPGNDVEIEISLVNNGTNNNTFEFVSNHTLDLLIYDGHGFMLRNLSEEMVYNETRANLTVGAGEKLRIQKFVWDQKDSIGREVPDGTYTIFAKLFGTDVRGSASISIIPKLVLNIITEKEHFAPGEAVNMSMEIENQGTSDIWFNFTSSPPSAYIKVLDSDNKVVFEGTDGLTHVSKLEPAHLKPGDSLLIDYNITWNQTDHDYIQVKNGTSLIHIQIFIQGYDKEIIGEKTVDIGS